MSLPAKLEHECALLKSTTEIYTINISSLMEHAASGRTIEGESPLVMITSGVL